MLQTSGKQIGGCWKGHDLVWQLGGKDPPVLQEWSWLWWSWRSWWPWWNRWQGRLWRQGLSQWGLTRQRWQGWKAQKWGLPSLRWALLRPGMSKAHPEGLSLLHHHDPPFIFIVLFEDFCVFLQFFLSLYCSLLSTATQAEPCIHPFFRFIFSSRLPEGLCDFLWLCGPFW